MLSIAAPCWLVYHGEGERAVGWFERGSHGQGIGPDAESWEHGDESGDRKGDRGELFEEIQHRDAFVPDYEFV